MYRCANPLRVAVLFEITEVLEVNHFTECRANLSSKSQTQVPVRDLTGTKQDGYALSFFERALRFPANGCH